MRIINVGNGVDQWKFFMNNVDVIGTEDKQFEKYFNIVY